MKLSADKKEFIIEISFEALFLLQKNVPSLFSVKSYLQKGSLAVWFVPTPKSSFEMRPSSYLVVVYICISCDDNPLFNPRL